MFKTTTVFALSLTALIGASAQAQTDLLIGSTSASSSHYGYFVAVSKVINDSVEGVNSSVAETGATLDNLRRISRNQIDLGLVTTNTLYDAYNGQGDFDGRPVQSKLLWVYSLAPQNVVVRSDAGVDELQQLDGTSFNPGIRGSSTEATTEAVFTELDISPDYARGSTTDVVNAIKDNRMIGYVKSGSGLKLDASTRDIATQTEIKILGLTDEQAKTVSEALPQLSLVDVPENGELNLPSYKTWGFAVGASASDGLSEDTAYQIVKAVMEDSEQQVAAMPTLKEEGIAEMTLKYATTPLHPATVRYLKEQGHEVPERLIGE